MLVAKFLSRISIGVKDPNASTTRDAELKLQSTVSKEFEKFLTSGQFTQKNLEIFEAGLRTRMSDYCEKELNVVLKTVPNAASHRVLTSQRSNASQFGQN